MRLALSSYTYTWATGVPGKMPEKRLDAFGLLAEATRLKVPCIQIADNMPLHELSPAQMQKLKREASDRSISIEVGARGMSPENLEKYITIAAFFNSSIVRFVIDGNQLEPSINDVISIIRNALPLLKANSVHLALENHDRFHVTDFKNIIENTDIEWVGICLDTVNSFGAAEGIELVVNTLAPFTINLHVKDFTIYRIDHKMGFIVEGRPAGQGMLPVPWLIREIKNRGKCQTAVLELWTPPEQTLKETIAKEKKWAEESISFLQKEINNMNV